MPPVQEADERPELEFRVDGVAIDIDDLSFKEADEYQAAIRELSGDAEASMYVAEPIYRWPALYWIFKRRSDPEYTLEDAQGLKQGDVLFPVEKEKGTKRPTRERVRS